MMRISLKGDREIVARLTSMPGNLQNILRRRIWSIILKLQARVHKKLSGQVLNVVTGALRRSIQSDVKDSGSVITGRVFSTGDVKYARIHEYGGKTRAHIIEPRKAEALAFMMGGKHVFAKRVNHPGSVMPQRSFLRSSLSEMRQEIVRELTDGIVEASMRGGSGG